MFTSVLVGWVSFRLVGGEMHSRAKLSPLCFLIWGLAEFGKNEVKAGAELGKAQYKVG